MTVETGKEFRLKHSHRNQGRSILPMKENYSFRAILRNWDAQKSEDKLECYEYFFKVWLLLAPSFHTSKPTGCFCAHRARAADSAWERAGWLPRRDDTSGVLRDAQEPSRMEIIFPGREKNGQSIRDTNKHVQEVGYETAKLVCLCMLLKLGISTAN